jgi:hypothetical protein
VKFFTHVALLVSKWMKNRGMAYVSKSSPSNLLKEIIQQIFKSPFLRPGVDVMITIFCDFCQFSAKKIGFFKNQCYDQIFA